MLIMCIVHSDDRPEAGTVVHSRSGTHTAGHHECPDSPWGICAYNANQDPVHDDCVFCHQPEERK